MYILCIYGAITELMFFRILPKPSLLINKAANDTRIMIRYACLRVHGIHRVNATRSQTFLVCFCVCVFYQLPAYFYCSFDVLGDLLFHFFLLVHLHVIKLAENLQ